MFTLWAFWCDSERVVHYAFQDRAVAEDWRARYDDGNEFGHQCGPHRLVECGPTPMQPCATAHPHHLLAVDGAPRIGWLECPDCLAVKGSGSEPALASIKVCAVHCPLETTPVTVDPVTAKPRIYFMACKRRLVGGPHDGLVFDWPSGMREIIMPTQCELPAPPCDCTGIAAAVYRAQEVPEDGQQVAWHIGTHPTQRKPGDRSLHPAVDPESRIAESSVAAPCAQCGGPMVLVGQREYVDWAYDKTLKAPHEEFPRETGRRIIAKERCRSCGDERLTEKGHGKVGP